MVKLQEKDKNTRFDRPPLKDPDQVAEEMKYNRTNKVSGCTARVSPLFKMFLCFKVFFCWGGGGGGRGWARGWFPQVYLVSLCVRCALETAASC